MSRTKELQPLHSVCWARSDLDGNRTNRMRVVFVSLRGGGGGSNASLLTLLGYMPDNVVRVLACPPGELADRGISTGYVDEFVPLIKRFRTAKLRRLSMALQLAHWLWTQRDDLDAVHANGLSEMNIALPGALMSRLRLVVVARWARSSRWLRASGPLYRAALSRVIFTAVSDTARDVVAESRLAPSRSVAVIGNPISPSEVIAGTRPDGPPWVFGYLGSDLQSKGMDMVGPAILATADRSVRWKIFMDEPRYDHASPGMRDVMRLAQSEELYVEFVGRSSPVRDAYADCHIIFIPSTYESFCRVAAEAALNGRGIVVSDLPATREILDGYENTWFFPPSSEDGCRRALNAATEALERDECVEAVPLAMKNRVDGSTIAKRLSALYAS